MSEVQLNLMSISQCYALNLSAAPSGHDISMTRWLACVSLLYAHYTALALAWDALIGIHNLAACPTSCDAL